MQVSPNAPNAIYRTYTLLPQTAAVLVHCQNTCSLGVPLNPVLRVLLKLLAILSILVRDRRLDGIIGVGLNQERLDEPEDSDHLVWRLPLIWAE